MGECENKCAQYRDPKLCTSNSCWSTCNNTMDNALSLGSTTVTLNSQNGLQWASIPGAVLYIIAYRLQGETTWPDGQYVTSDTNSIARFSPSNINFCAALEVEVMAVSEDGVGKPSKVVEMPAPKPMASAKLELSNMKYLDQRFIDDSYEANGTIELTFEYFPSAWPLGVSDFELTPIFHMVSCIEADLSQGVPVPSFVNGEGNSTTIIVRMGSDMMYRKCTFIYYLQAISSQQCGTTTEFNPDTGDIQKVQIQCSKVEDAPCSNVITYPSPICGQVENVKYTVISPDKTKVFSHFQPIGQNLDLKDPSSNLTVNVTFSLLSRQSRYPTIYYIGVYGDAVSFPNADQELFVGVNITHVIGKVTSCQQFTPSGDCVKENANHSLIISGIHPLENYGITICAVFDPRNLTIPDIITSDKSIRPRADLIYIHKAESQNHTGLIIGVTLSGVIVAVFLVATLIYYLKNKHRKQEKLYKLKIAQIEHDKNRYIDFPVTAAKHDIWEIERRNLIIHNDKKLGSGAFGAVYLGRLIGKSLAHKDANSPLGVNLMRAENCEVAVKMLPEYADDMSKSEFLREIGLMKTLGYHERLVNMLACVTDSEPLCLIVEYCSDGDLLQYLRARCKYMMKLDDLGVNYHEAPVDNNYDPNMIITIKQLLQFAVQISYGLEFLSQKGFVHRDVAARNVLVHEGKSCKIGDFGLCRYIYGNQSQYKSKGGRLPLKWMSPEAIRNYEFSIKSDVWSFGILLFEIITLGGSPYPGMPPEDVLPFLESKGRIEQPDNCPDNFYEIMLECWHTDPDDRIEFSECRQKLAGQLEEITEDYSYLTLDAAKDYYNVQYGEEKQ